MADKKKINAGKKAPENKPDGNRSPEAEDILAIGFTDALLDRCCSDDEE